MVRKVYLRIHLIVLFYAVELLIVLCSNLCGQLFSSLKSPKTFEEIFKVTTESFLIPGFNLLSGKLENFTFKVLYLSFLF